MPADSRVLAYDASFARVYDHVFSDDEANDAPVEFLAQCFDGVEVLLELGVGTGRVALPLADRGFRVIGVDDSAEMLGRLRDKEGERAIEIHHADMSDLASSIRAGGIYSILGSLSCVLDPDARRRVFERARRTVPTGARFVLEVYNPAVIRAMHEGRSEPVEIRVDYPDRGALSSTYRLGDDAGTWVARHTWHSPDEQEAFGEIVALVDPMELVAEAAPWWRPLALFRDWSSAPLDADQGPLLVLVMESVDSEEPE